MEETMTRDEFVTGQAFSYGEQFVGYAYRSKTETTGTIITIIDGKHYCDVVCLLPTVAMITLPLFGHAALRYANCICWRTEVGKIIVTSEIETDHGQ